MFDQNYKSYTVTGSISVIAKNEEEAKKLAKFSNPTVTLNTEPAHNNWDFVPSWKSKNFRVI